MGDSPTASSGQDIVALVHDVIDETGPVRWQKVATITFVGKENCGECGRRTAEFERHRQLVKSVVLDLSDNGRVTPNADWEYRTLQPDSDHTEGHDE